MSIIEKNFKLARFMGGLISGEGRLSLRTNEMWIPNHSVVYTYTTDLGNGPTIHYHDRWDWLMEVVEKIESTVLENVDIDGEEMSEVEFYVKIEGMSCSIAAQEVVGIDVLEDWIKAREETKIKTVYAVCVKFVEWYETIK